MGDIPLHSSIAVGLVLIVDGEAVLLNDAGDSVCLAAEAPAAIMPSGAPHAKPAVPAERDRPTLGVLGIIEPASAAGRVLLGRLDQCGDRRYPKVWQAAATPCVPAVRVPEPDDPAGLRVLSDAMHLLTETDPPRPPDMHPALRRVLALIPRRLAGNVRLQELAAEVGLSASRLGHLFTVELGMPYRAYVRWARLQTAVDCLRAGATLTETAHTAGFTDSAHLNRTCRQLFGQNPSEIISNVTWV